MEHRDEIDQWLLENYGAMPGCCSAQGSFTYDLLRDVAEKLWLTWEDIWQIIKVNELYSCEMVTHPYRSQEYCQEVLKRFNEQKKK